MSALDAARFAAVAGLAKELRADKEKAVLDTTIAQLADRMDANYTALANKKVQLAAAEAATGKLRVEVECANMAANAAAKAFWTAVD